MSGIILANSFLSSLVISSVVSILSVVFGIYVSFNYDIPPSGSVVGIAILLFLASFLLRKLPLK